MQRVAAEMNLSETAFVQRLAAGAPRYSLRWFTPVIEAELCGHATLATAHVLYERGELARDEVVTFESRFSGELRAHSEDGLIWLDFPRLGIERAPMSAGLGEALGNPEVVWSGRAGTRALIEVADSALVRALAPDFTRLSAVDSRSVMITARSDDPEYDFVSRYFAPACGVPEDPVTGSAHCALGPYWAAKLGRVELRAFQASRRGGSLRVRVGELRIGLGGEAVTILSGTLRPACFPSLGPAN
jgi:PhzF family phenazine biosynthesis protein